MSAPIVIAHPGTAPPGPLVAREGGLAPALREAFLPSRAAERLFSPGALAVTTGQQPGLFGGPAFVLHKALAAAALAEALADRWGRDVVPIFWCAGDDHDHAEATAAAWWAGERRVEVTLPPRHHGAPQHPMTREPLPLADVRRARERLAHDLPPGPDRDRVLAWIDAHWRDGQTIASAFRDAIAALLAPYGVAVLDPTHPAFKRAQVPLLARAIRDSASLDAVLAALPDAGTGIAAGDGATLVFVEGSAGRDRVMREGQRLRARRGGDAWQEDELLALLASAPERFSANVLLRPVVEAALLPTVAYVAGPGEYRYLAAQASALYAPLDVAPQQPVPRWGGTLVDATAARLLDRVGVTAEAVLADDGSLAHAILRRDLDPSALEALATLRAAIDRASAAADRTGRAIDGVLPRAVAARQRRLHDVTDNLEQLLERHLKKRDDIALAQYRRLQARLRPADAPQERAIGVAGMLGHFGDAWLDAVRLATRAWARDVTASAA